MVPPSRVPVIADAVSVVVVVVVVDVVPLSAFPHFAGKDDSPFLGASDCHDIEISGHGMIDGQGKGEGHN